MGGVETLIGLGVEVVVGGNDEDVWDGEGRSGHGSDQEQTRERITAAALSSVLCSISTHSIVFSAETTLIILVELSPHLLHLLIPHLCLFSMLCCSGNSLRRIMSFIQHSGNPTHLLS